MPDKSRFLIASVMALAAASAPSAAVTDLSRLLQAPVQRGGSAVDITFQDGLTLLARELAVTTADLSTRDSPAGRVVIVYEGWRESHRTVLRADVPPGTISPLILREESRPRFTLRLTGQALEAALTDLCDLRGSVAWTVDEASGVISVREADLEDRPEWPLNRPLGPHGAQAMSLEEATDLLRREYGLRVLGPPNIWGVPAMGETIWQPAGRGTAPTARDLLFAIARRFGRAGRWYGAFAATPASGENDLGAGPVHWTYGPGE